MIEVPHFVPAKPGILIPGLRPPVTHKYEHPRYINEAAFRIPIFPAPNYYPELPYHLRKFILRRIECEIGAVAAAPFWEERAMHIERRVQNLVSTIPELQNLVRHEQYTRDNQAGSDLSGEIDGELIHVEVKSSRYTIIEYKHAIKDEYFADVPYSEALINKWLTKHRIILVNGSETRSDNDILFGSIYPQLERIRLDMREAA